MCFRPYRFAVLLRVNSVLWLLSCHALLAMAQLPTAELTRVSPCHSRAGETVQVQLHGKNLDQVTELRFTHAGISARPVKQPPDPFYPDGRSVELQFVVDVARDVPPGIYECRTVGYFGYSTARAFVVDAADSRVVSCDGSNTDWEHALEVSLNTTVTGHAASRAWHWFRFSARRGQRVLLDVLAERIDSRLDSQLVVFAADGTELKRNRDTFGRDSFVEVQPSYDGDYYVALSDILFRGGNDHFYRLKVHTGPHIDFVWPPAGPPGAEEQYTIYGRNLPGGEVTAVISDDGMALQAVRRKIVLPDEPEVPDRFFSGQPRQGILPAHFVTVGDSNPVRIGFATAPIVEERSTSSHQVVPTPAEIYGRFDTEGDEDVFRFHAQQGETWFLEVIADRMQSAVDPCLILEHIVTNEDGTEEAVVISENDDMPSFFSLDGKDTINFDTTDSALEFTAAESGVYQVTLVNQFASGSAEHIYRLAIRRQTPDFQLMASTERPLPTNRTGFSVTPHLRKHGRWAVRIVCPRQDHFSGDITVTAHNLPSGVSALPLVLSGTTDRGLLVIKADETAGPWAGDIQIVGHATAGSKVLTRSARFAAIVWGHIFADSIRVRSRLTQRIPLSVNGYESAPVVLDASATEWMTTVGGQLEMPVTVRQLMERKGNLTVQPAGIPGMHRNPPSVNVAQDAASATLTISFVRNGNFDVQPGRYQFALTGTGVAAYRRNERAVQLSRNELQRLEKLKNDFADRLQQLKAGIAQDDTGEREPTEEERAKQIRQFEAHIAQLKRLIDQTQKTLQQREQAAAPKDTSFAVWSDLQTVLVSEPAN